MIILPGYTMLASVLLTLALSFIFLVLYRTGRDHFMLSWFIAWISYAAMFLMDLINFNTNIPEQSYLMFRHMAGILGSYMFLESTAEFLDFKVPTFIRPLFMISLVSSALYPVVPTLMDTLLLPNVVVLSFMIVFSGCRFLSRSWTRNVPERTFAGIIILMWSIFINHFSFTYKIQFLAVMSYYLGLAIINILIVTIMIIYFRKRSFLDNQNSERFRLLVENSSDTMFLFNYRTGQFEYVSRSIYPLIGISAEHLYQVPGCFFDNVKIGEGNERLASIFTAPVHNAGNGLLLTQKNGVTERWAQVNYVPITDSTGSVIAVEGVMRDITEQKRAAQEVAAAEQAKKEFLQDISHEIKTPITIINGYTETLMNELVPKESASTFIRLIHSKAQILNNLLDDLASASDFSSQTMEYRFYEKNAEDYFIQCIDEARVYISESNHQFIEEKSIDPKAVVILDENRIMQVISNLVNNALRHTPDGGLITISCQSQRYEHMLHLPDDVSDRDIPMGEIIFTVQDTGDGIPEEDLPYIFERNYSGKNRQKTTIERNASGRTGLGLFISKQIISQHSGTIHARNAITGGAEFTFRLPYYL